MNPENHFTIKDINTENLPCHIGIIMDGNGRWARKRGRPRSFGHDAGLKAAKRIVKAASELGIRYITLYIFSTENWKRAESEVSFLMHLIKKHLKKEYEFYRKNNIRVIHSGDLESLPPDIRQEIRSIEELTGSFKGTVLNLAINYGGRDEIVRAVNRWMSENRKDLSGLRIDAEKLSRFLDHPEIAEPDLIIRTAGEQRTSNFLLWQSAYSELYFSPIFWPEWDKQTLITAIVDFQKRERRFGGIKEKK